MVTPHPFKEIQRHRGTDLSTPAKQQHLYESNTRMLSPKLSLFIHKPKQLIWRIRESTLSFQRKFKYIYIFFWLWDFTSRCDISITWAGCLSGVSHHTKYIEKKEMFELTRRLNHLTLVFCGARDDAMRKPQFSTSQHLSCFIHL